LHVQINPVSAFLSWDRSYFYFITYWPTGTNSIDRIVKTGGTQPQQLTTTRNVISRARPKNNSVYWSEILADGSGSKLMEYTNLGHTNTLTTLNARRVFDLFPTETELYWLQLALSTDRVELLVGLL